MLISQKSPAEKVTTVLLQPNSLWIFQHSQSQFASQLPEGSGYVRFLLLVGSVLLILAHIFHEDTTKWETCHVARPQCSRDPNFSHIYGWLTLCRLKESLGCWIKYDCPARPVTMQKNDWQSPKNKSVSVLHWLHCEESHCPLSFGVREARGWRTTSQASVWDSITGTTGRERYWASALQMKSIWILMHCIVPYVGDRLEAPPRQHENVRRAQKRDGCVLRKAEYHWQS